MKSALTFAVATLIAIGSVKSQKVVSQQDYERAVGFLWNNVNNKKAFNLFVRPNWFPDSSGIWYIVREFEKKSYRKVVFPRSESEDLFDHEKLASLLGDKLQTEAKASDLPIAGIEYISPNELELSVDGKVYLLNTNNHDLQLKPPDKEEEEIEGLSPNEKWRAYTEDFNLILENRESGDSKGLSTAGQKNFEYASWYGWGDIMEGEGGDRPERFWVNWSADSKWIYTSICDLRSAEKMYLLDWSQDSLYRPRLISYYRGSPGDTTMVHIKPVFFNVATGEEISPQLPRSTHINSAGMRWSMEEGTAYFSLQSRGYQNQKIYRYDIAENALEELYSEISETNIDNFSYWLAEKSNAILFLSEKSGWRQLYSLNLKNKQVTPLTIGQYYINNVLRIDEDSKKVYFLASGKENNRNPYHQHLYSIGLNGKGLKLLTEEDLHHQVSISHGGDYFVDNASTANSQTETHLRDIKTGKVIASLAKADVSQLKGWSPPELFEVTARDGSTPIYGALWKPTHFDPNKKYPIIDHSYTGPHTQMFPKDFRRVLSTSNQALAELGFIVMMVDGLGSSGRSKAFHNYSYKNLGGNLADHVGAIRQLGAQYAWIDTTRIGIFGHSAGGYDAAHALLAYPDFYKVAVSSSADHDHRMEKAWWPEMYMGWPVDSAYHLQSNITMAPNLKGKLLITHGGIDENVNPSATFKLADALIKADKQFDMLILPSQRHGYRGTFSDYFVKTRWNYFVEHLLEADPIWDFSLKE